MKFKKVKKIFAVASVITLVSGVTAFADTHIYKPFNQAYKGLGSYQLDVDYESGMRSCKAKAWGNDNYEYKVKLTIVYSDGQEVIQDTGYQLGEAYISRSYEWAEDYQAYMSVKHDRTITGVNVSGS